MIWHGEVLSILAVIGSHWVSSGHTIRATNRGKPISYAENMRTLEGKGTGEWIGVQIKKIDTRITAREEERKGGGDYIAPSVFHGD